jgi:hypothetical protein
MERKVAQQLLKDASIANVTAAKALSSAKKFRHLTVAVAVVTMPRAMIAVVVVVVMARTMPLEVNCWLP